MLYEYQKMTQRFVRDQQGRWIDPGDYTDFINRARREIAGRTQCLYNVSQISGGITAINVTAPGSGYTAPVATITPPDFPSHAGSNPSGIQATAQATQIGGQLASVNLIQGGSGYFQPSVTITDPHGTGATAAAVISPLSVTMADKEVYLFSDIPLNNFPGYDSILFVQSVAFIYANYRYVLPCYPWTIYQAMIRQYPNQYLYVPTMCAQLGQGNTGSIYMYPIPSAVYQMEWSFVALPSNLLSDNDVEAIPQPWQDGVPYFAAHLCYLELQNLNAAQYYLGLYEKMVGNYSRYARPRRLVNPYGRW